MRVADPKHVLFLIFILCWSSELWLKIQAKKYNPNDSNSHKCKSYELVREDITAKCINYFKLTKRSHGFESYELNHERSNLIDVSDERMEGFIEQWKNGTDQGPDCYFSRLLQKAVIDCCGGWEKPLCIKPACDPPCLNGGICSQPGTCDCLPDFAGNTCEDDKKNVNSKRKYCYLNKWCYGAKPNSTRSKRYKDVSFNEVMDKMTCCSLESAGGWGLAGESCEACPNTPLEDSADFVPDLPKVILNKDDLPFRTCIGMGPNYWRSFDGIEFLFPGRCAYTLLDADLIKVTVKLVECYSFVKCRKRLNIFFKEHLLAVVEGAKIMVGGKFTQITQVQGYSDPVNGFKIEKRGDYFYLQLMFVRLRWDENSTFFLTLEKSEDIKTKGICGDYNGNPYDDLKTPGGLKVTHPLEFGNSWVVLDDMEQCPTAETYGYPCNTTALENKALDSCGKIWQAPFRSCHSSVHPNPYFERCVSDYCLAEQYSREHKLSEVDRQKELQSAICQAFGSYSQICALREVPFNWRSTHLCPRRCPYGMMYTECAPKCMKTCQNLYLDPNPLACSDKECSPGCQCLTGTFFNGSHCVPANRCPCVYRGENFDQGSSVNIGCNLCQCNYGRWKCTKKMCSKICSVIGFQHFNTFDGNKFDFHGPEGSYTLVEYFSSFLDPSDTSGSERGDLSIIYSVTKCLLMSPDISCISGFRVELKAGYKTYIVTVNKNFEVLLNGEILDDPAIRPFNDLNLYVKKVTSLFITVQGYGFRILYDKHGRLYIRLEPFYSGKVQGLCGNMDGSVQNDYKSRNGIEEDLLSFAMSYSHGAGSLDDAHLAGDTCSSGYGSATLYAERHCTLVGKEEIFGPCLAVLVDWNRYFDICMQDSCASPGSPEPICTALAALAERCAAAGFELEPNWMAHPEVFDLCGSVEGYQCHYGQVFSDCAPHQPSCRDNQYPSHIPDDNTCIAGCKCGNPGDFQDHQSVCVPREDCSCYEYISKKVYKAKEIWNRACGNCICSNATWDCSKSNCGKTIKCPFNQIFVYNVSSCGSTCVSLDTPGYCDANEFRFDGCTCPSDTVLHPDGNCVPPDDCPCSYSSKLFQARETVTIGCKTFQCQKRHWKLVSKSNCRAICSATGDPHYKTFDGRCYSFQGPCEYIMTQEKTEKLFIVTLENVPCGSQGVTCTKSVTVKVKNTIIKLMRGLEVTINDVPVDSNRPRTFFGGIMVSSGLFVVLSFHLGFDVMWDGGTRVYISMSDQHKNSVEGLCGNFDDNYQNEFQDVKSGSLISTPQSFGFKWRATNLCKSKGLADDFDPCKDFPERLKWAEPVCRVIKDHEMFEECRKLVTSFKDYYSNCIYDSCGCDHGNNCECTCTAIAAFAQECSFKGIYVNWRSNNLCPKMCEKGHEYKVCGSPCRQTCGGYGKTDKEGCEASECVEGCFCPDGFYENEDGVCVPLAECKCSHEGSWLSPGTIIEVDCQTCTCSNAELSCGGKHCVNNCTDDQYWCKNSTKCIPMTRKCDGIVDCPKQFDELECAWKCKPEEFTCAFDGTCIPKSRVCNGFPDCGDESDERICNQTCPGTFFECTTNRCIPISLICDGVEDCGLEDDSDEANCTEICNPIDFFRCDNSKCMPKTVRCDEVDDCGDGSDESGCAPLSTISPSKLCPVDMSAVDFVHGEQTFSIRVNEEMDGSDALLGSRKHLVLTSPRQDFIVIDKPTPVESFTLKRISLWANGALTCEMKVVDVNGEETKYRRKIVENMVSYEFDNGGLSDVLQILLYFESGYAVNVQNLEVLACVQEIAEFGYGSKPYGMFPTCPDPQPLYFNSDLPSLITLYRQGFRKPVDAQDSLKFSPVSKWQVQISAGNNYSYIVEIAKRCHGDWYISAIEMMVEGIREFQMFVGSRVIKRVKLKDESQKFTYDQPIFGNQVGFAFKATKETLSISGFHLTACCLSPGLAEPHYRKGTSRFPSGRPVGMYPEDRESSSPIGAGLSVVPGMGKPATRPGFFKPLKQTKPSFRREKITKRRKPKPGVGLGGEFVESESTYHPKHFEETKHFGAKEWDKWPAWFKTTLHPGKKGSKNKLKKQTKAGLPFADSKRQFPEQEIPSDDTEDKIERPTKPIKAGKGLSIAPGKWLIPSLKPKSKMYPEFDNDEENYDYFELDKSHLENLNKYPVENDFSGYEDIYPGKPDYRDDEDRIPKDEYPRDHVYFDERYPEMQGYPENEGEYLEQYPEGEYPEYGSAKSDKGYPEDQQKYPEDQQKYPEDQQKYPENQQKYPEDQEYEYYHPDSEGRLDRPGMHWHKTTPYKRGLKATSKGKPFTGWGNYGPDNAWWDIQTSKPGKFKPFFRSTKSQRTLKEVSKDGFWGESNDTSVVPDQSFGVMFGQTLEDLWNTPGTVGLCLKPYLVDFKCNFNYEAQLISENNMVIRDLKKSDIFRPKPLWTPPASLAGRFIVAITNLEACDKWFVMSVKFALKGVTQFSVVVGTQSILSEMEIRGGEVTKIYKEGIFEGSTVEVIIEERRKRCSIYDMEVIYCCEFVPTTATTSTTVALTTTATSTTTMIPTSIQTTTTLTTAQATSVPTTRPTTTITIPTEMTTVTETTKVPTTITPQAAGSCEMEKRNVLEWAIDNSLPCQFPSSDLEITTCKGICESFTQGHVEFVNGPFINPVRSCQCCGGTGSFINITGINCTGPGFISNQTQTLTVFVYDSCSCQEGHCFTGNGLSSTTVKTTPAPLCDPKLPYVYVKSKSRNNFKIILQLQSGQPVTDRNIRDLISDKIFWSPPAILQKGFSIKMDILEECSTQWIILGVKFQMKGVRTYSVAVGNTLVSDYEDAEEGLSKFVKEGTYYGSSLVITIHKRFKEMYINCVEMVACCGSTTIEMAILAD